MRYLVGWIAVGFIWWVYMILTHKRFKRLDKWDYFAGGVVSLAGPFFPILWLLDKV